MKTSYLALNFALTGDDSLPDRLELIPAGAFSGLDGRAWNNPFPDAVIERTRSVGRDIPVDIEHATEIKGPQGEAAPAQGWIRLDSLDVINGSIWGKVEWNNSGRALLSDKAYRYYSPAFLFDDEGEVRSIKSVGLTNTQNLSQLPALNQQQPGEIDDMSLSAAIRQALSLKEDANEADAVQAIGQLKNDHQLALNRAETPDPERFVPKADLELALNRANTAETTLKTINEAKLEAAIDHAIQVDKKIAPASRDHYLALCREASNPLEKFQNLVGTLPAIVGTEGVGGKKPEEDQEQSKLSADELAMCRDMGLTEAEFLSAKA